MRSVLESKRQAQAASRPDKKRRQRANVQPGEHQDVIHARCLIFDDAIMFDKTAISQQHCACKSGLIGPRGENLVDRIQEAATRARQAIGNCQTRMVDDGQKLAAAQRALQLNVLARKVSAIIEAAGIAEIANGQDAGEAFDAVSGARRREDASFFDSSR